MRLLSRSIRALFLAALLSPAASAPAQQEEDLAAQVPKVPSIPDAAQFFRLEQVTIVYPAGDGERAEENQRSARFRAELLKRRYRMDAQVAADGALTEEQKNGNLLILGWRNRVFDDPKVARPFVKRERGFSFSGLDEQNPLTDLMFFTYSPFRAGKFLFFWSRIDPELDRFQPLPFVGSNWAEQRDFLVIRQGMFDPEKPWPPVRNENAEADQVERLLEIDSQRTIRRTPHYEVYYLAGAALDRDLDAIVAARESAFAKAVAVLGAPPEDFKIRLLLYDSATDKKERSGVKDEAHSVPRAREIHLVQRMALVPSAHEEIHVLARQKLGPSFLTAMYEGLALAEDGIYAGTELDVLAAILVEQNAVPSLDNLFDEARFQSLEDRVAFPSAGLLVRFLRETAGPEGVARAYGLPYDAGLAGLAKALGKEAQPLAASWDRYTRDRAAARKADLEFRRQQVKAQERYAAADYAGVAEALEKALRARPEDPQTFFNLGAARMRTGEYAKAEKAFRQILAQTLAKKDAHLAAFSHYQIGRIYDVQGRRDAALAEYRIVLGLPDVNDSHRLANEALAQPVTQDQLE